MNHNFRELKIWQRSMHLCTSVYELTKRLPEDEKYGLISQVRRCSVSIPGNIAEGCGRNTNKQLVNFLNISMGSLSELETQLILCNRLDFIDNEKSQIHLKEIEELQKMISVFINKMKIKNI